MKTCIGRIFSRKSAITSCLVSENGIRKVINIVTIIILLKTIIRCLIFNGNTPLIKNKRFITAYYRNIRCFNFGYLLII